MKELKKLYNYIKNELKEEDRAQKFIQRIMCKLKILEEFPKAYKLLKKTKNFEYRKFIIKNYVVIYKINLKEKEVNILHIYNQKQKAENKKEYSKL